MKISDSEQLVRTSIFLPAGLLERLRETAAVRRTSVAQLIRATLESAHFGSRPTPNGGFLTEYEL